jgi:hypothetical protein
MPDVLAFGFFATTSENKGAEYRAVRNKTRIMNELANSVLWTCRWDFLDSPIGVSAKPFCNRNDEWQEVRSCSVKAWVI